jgi:PKD repeat protein
MQMKKILLFLILTIFVNNIQAQNDDYLHCGYNKALQKLIDEGFDPAADRSNHELQFGLEGTGTEFAGSYMRGGQTIYIVPIVFHIIHTNGDENISNEQIIDAVRILNEDFNKMNADTSAVISQFENNVANIGFEFRLAQKDALGNCTNGITRTFSVYTDGTNDNEAVKDVNRNLNNSSTNTTNVRFPRNKYLNIWIFKSLEGAAGYTYKPNNWLDPRYDGIFIQNAYVGSIGTGNALRSRALTHECGHWFDLSHTWGDTNDPGVSCGSDGIADTPQTKGWTSCNLSGKSCPADPSPVDNVQNYMEYSYCSRMFTNGQKTAMISAIQSTLGQRNQLWQPTNIIASGVDQAPVLCQADFRANKLVICEGESVTFEDMSFNAVTGWNWTFTGGTPANSTSQTPTVAYNTAGTYNVVLSATDGTGNDTETKSAYILVLPAIGRGAPLLEGFESTTTLPSADWITVNPDEGQTFAITTTAASTGTKSIKLNNAAIVPGNVDELVSGTVDLSNMSTVVVTFKYAYAMKNASSSDILKVYASNDCGATWSMRKQIPASTLSSSPNQTGAFTPTSASQWEEGTVTNLSASYLTPNFRLKFEFTSGGGNNFYLDDINISSALGIAENTIDYGLIAYPNPFETQTNVSFTLENEKKVELDVYDMIGKQVMSLTKGELSGGSHTFSIDGSELESGVYFIKLKVDNNERVMKVVHQ